jgi:CYTH domain-containing protein
MRVEIEKKFLVENVPFVLNGYKYAEIVQGYIAVEEGYAEVRVRKMDNKYMLTIKSDRTNFRMEEECMLSTQQGKRLLNFCKDRLIRKTRYYIPYNEVIIELDIFRGPLEDLKIAEVEFKNIEEMNNFIIPSWFGPDITEDKRYKNKNLAIYGL